MKLPAHFSSFKWTVAWRYLKARQKHFQAKWAPVRVKEMRKQESGGA